MFVLDAYAARSCPVKTHNAFHPGIRLPAPADEELREQFHGGIDFENLILRTLIETAVCSVADLRGLASRASAEQEAALLEAAAAGTDVIIGGLLPRDWEGHRSGRPDLLIRELEGTGYHPAQIKYQKVLDHREAAPVLCSPLSDPRRRSPLSGFRYRWTLRVNNLLQLSHYWRLLEHAGLAAGGPRLAAIIGLDEVPDHVLSWVDLDAPRVTPNPRQVPDAEVIEQVSPLVRYDHEHGFRVQVAEQALACDPGDGPILTPVVNRECAYCPWWEICRPLLDDDDLSLRINKSPLDAHEIRVLRQEGVSTVAQLAEADLEDLLPRYLPQVVHRAGAEDRLRLAWRRARLLAQGIEFDKISTGPIEIPASASEIDVDIETSRDDRVYLWGFLVDIGDGDPEYVAFSDFSDLDAEAELALARRAIGWLRDLVAERPSWVFHYSDYELVRLERLAKEHDDSLLAWGVGYAREHFFDLFAVIREHFFGTQGLGLKVVASRAAGFNWRDSSPGGLNSQRWFADAVHAETEDDRALARARVLEYNEDDVRATWHVRHWLRTLG